MLKKIIFQSTYFKTRHELYEDFYKPCMENSVRYDRISGYFGSSIFIIINRALKTFIHNGGHLRILCSPVLKEEDLLAIEKGYNDKTQKIVEDNLEQIIDELSIRYPDGTKLLSKLISMGILEIRLAVFGENSLANRLMHDKAGVFIDDENNAVAFRGSINETYKGLSQFRLKDSELFFGTRIQAEVPYGFAVIDSERIFWRAKVVHLAA